MSERREEKVADIQHGTHKTLTTFFLTRGEDAILVCPLER